MTQKDALRWIKDNLSFVIKKSIEGTPYTEDWLAAMACREVWILIIRYAPTRRPSEMHPLMKGDYGQREGESKKQYHGFGYMQIDIGSYPDFVNSGDWKEPQKCFDKAVSVLNEKRAYITRKFPNLSGAALEDAITAAYNCGEGNVEKNLRKGKDVDSSTHGKDYSKDVRRIREMYLTL